MNKEEFLNKLYELSEAYKSDKDTTYQFIYEHIWMTFRFNSNIDYELMASVLKEVDLDKIKHTTVAVCLITAVFPYSDKCKEYYIFYEKFRNFMIKNKSEEYFDKYYKNFKAGACDFWKDMKILGAPEWITGVSPE